MVNAKRTTNLRMNTIAKLLFTLLTIFTMTTVATAGSVDIYSFKLKTLDGKDFDFASMKGKKLLLVNVASKCGYTPQYEKLQALHLKYGKKLVVIGIPSNDFGGQEPGSAQEIESFCRKNYGVSFIMMEKLTVKGKNAHPLYKWLANKEANGGLAGEAPSWNFCKFLINEKGLVTKFYKSSVDPLSDEIVGQL